MRTLWKRCTAVMAGGLFLTGLGWGAAGAGPARAAATSATAVNSGVADVAGPDGPPVGGTLDAGYLMATDTGDVLGFGTASRGSARDFRLQHPVVDIAGTPSGNGYWLVASDGGIFTFGDARFFGSTGNIQLNQPIVGMAGTPTGQGYWLVAADGGIFTFGDARFFGSTGDLRLNRPIVGMAATPSGNGYWLVASDGGIFTFGDARFLGSTGAMRLVKPIVGMAASVSGNGYWLVASDGGIFTFGDAVYYGSTGAMVLNKPIVGMAATPTGAGYWLVASDGGVFTFGDASFKAAPSAGLLDGRIVGLVPQGGDVRAPVLRSLRFGPTTVDTSTGEGHITFRARITDDLAGHATAAQGYGSTVIFRSPNGTIAQAFFGPPHRIAGDALDGVYEDIMTLPRYSPQGTWAVSEFHMVDAVGNTARVEGRTLAQAGYPTTFDQVGPGDAAAPHLAGLSVTPDTIDTSTGPATLTLRARFTDDLSGVNPNGTQIRFSSGGQVQDVTFDSAQLVSGDNRDGVWERSFTMPAGSAPGPWIFDLALLTDFANNNHYEFAHDLGISAGFRQVGAGDTTPPSLVSIGFTPTTVDTSQAPATVTVTARITDAGAGVGITMDDYSYNAGMAIFTSPSGQQATAWFGWYQYVSGDRHDATFRTTMTLPVHCEQGTWTLSQVHLNDVTGNQTNIYTPALAASGFPTTLEVVRTDGP